MGGIVLEKYYIYVVLVRTTTIISRLIQFAKSDEYTHAAISFDIKLDSMYSFSRKHTYYPFIGRFQHEELNKGVYGTHKILPGMIMEIEVTKEQHEKAKELLNQFVSNSNYYKYNYIGLLYSLINKPIHYDNRFLCSEFVYHILNESGIADLNIPRNLVRPQNLLRLDSKCVYKGNLKEIQFAK